ncbi:MAG: ATP-binding protein [Moraxellaceae bacterium]|nr:ATP-binding protein [Moraxellaceae bacterium]
MKKLPLGIQTFAKIRTDNYLYIDKSHLAEALINNYQFVFLSRPRRFGKSLFLSTLHDLFAGRKELFTGLAVEKTHDWQAIYPVIHIGLSGNQQSEKECRSLIYNKLLENQQRLNLIDCENDNLSVFFERIIHQAHKKYGQKVVILIDEYDKPLLDNITNSQVSEKIRSLLQGFYATMKENDKFLRFVFLTGVSKFSKVSIFSGLNNLKDISLSPDYATICGYTQQDIETSFAEHLQGVDWDKLKEWYNGYQFNGEPVYNPYDILMFIDSQQKYSNYWFETATPTFLMKQLQQKQYYLPNIDTIMISESDMHASHIDDLRIESLLLQTGYLTINKIEETPMGLFYHLSVPNKEVRISLSENLLQTITQPTEPTSYNRNALYQNLHNADMNGMEQTLIAIFASIPYHLYSNSPLAHYEGYYSVVMYAYLLSLGVDIQLERSTNKGRLDMVVDIANKRYLIEFKMNGKGDALQQIKDKQYFQAFYDTEKEIYLVGIDFSEEQRNVSKFVWEKK